MVKKFSSALLPAALISSLLGFTGASSAQNLEIPVGQQGTEQQELELPSLGMDKNYVEELFGPPTATRGPVGNPPITTWVYDNYSVYFEYDTVIHSVLKP